MANNGTRQIMAGSHYLPGGHATCFSSHKNEKNVST